MPTLDTPYYRLQYEQEDELTFPAGLFGFANEKRFLLVEQEQLAPLLALQSLSTPPLCFLVVPLGLVVPDYTFAMGAEERDLLGIAGPTEGKYHRFGIVTIRRDGPSTVNLLAPVLVNLDSRRGCQALHADSGYSHAAPLTLQLEAAC